MSNYIIEGDIDFYNELYKSINNIELSELEELENLGEKKQNENNKYCLISGDSLNETHIVLDCNHAFNYIPLFKDLVNYKRKFSIMEINRIKPNEIRCPYCRNKQTNLLPYYDHLGLEKVQGINCLTPIVDNIVLNSTYKHGVCCWEDCPYTYVNMFPTNNKEYCYTHWKKMSKQVQLENKLILKKKVKESAKLAKTTMLAAALNDNVILSSGICKQILKNGLRKNQICGAKSNSNGYCLRHLKMNSSV